MATKIITKNSSTATSIPTAGDLVQGELAVNVTDKRLFTEDSGGAIVELGTNPSTIDINAGTIDGTTIGGTTAAAGSFTTVNASGTLKSTASAEHQFYVGDNSNWAYIKNAGAATGTTQLGFYVSGDTPDLLISGTGAATFSGDIITTTLGTSNLTLGVNAGNSIIAGGDYNVVVGDEAGTALTTGVRNTFLGYAAGDALTDADFNVAIGYNTLTADTLGSGSVGVGYKALTAQNFTSATDVYNTAVGHVAGASITTGVQNTLIGGLAGDAITTGGFNTALGYSSLSTNTTGQENTAIGRESLLFNTTGTNNVAVGQSALQQNTTAANNTAVGYDALRANTTGIENTAVGHNAGATTTIGTSNTAVGVSALFANTTGGANTGIGRNALAVNTTGSYNIGLGYLAGAWTASGIVTGSYNIHVGYATNPGTTSSDNELVIATGNNGATGKGTSTGWFDNLTSGIYQANNSSAWATTSDERLKKNIVDNNTGLSILNQLQVRNFEHRVESEITELPPEQRIKGEGVQLGVIAQEVQQILPECVTELDTGVLAVDTSNLTWYLVNAVKELSTQLDAALARITTLEG